MPLTLDKTAFLQLPTADEYATLECVSNTISPPAGLISNAKWTGVPLATLLKQAGLQSDSNYLIFRSADGYSVGVPIDRALEAGALLAVQDERCPSPNRTRVPSPHDRSRNLWYDEREVDQ